MIGLNSGRIKVSTGEAVSATHKEGGRSRKCHISPLCKKNTLSHSRISIHVGTCVVETDRRG